MRSNIAGTLPGKKNNVKFEGREQWTVNYTGTFLVCSYKNFGYFYLYLISRSLNSQYPNFVNNHFNLQKVFLF